MLFWGAVYSYFFASQLNIGLVHIGSFATLAYVFYIGFVKFYRRYSLEAVMAASVFSKKDG